MNSNITNTVQSFAPGELIELCILDSTVLGGPVFYFTSSANGDDPIQFDGITYTPIDIEAVGFEWNGQGSLPTPIIKISNVTKAASAAVITYGDL